MIHSLDNHVPQLHPEARIAANATLVGKVSVGPAASIWYGAVLRGDECSIRLGAGSNVQDQAVVHGDPDFPTVIGRDVTVGHGAILLNGCVIGAGSLVAAGALVTQNTVIPPGSLVMGSPAKAVRPLRPDEQESLPHSAQLYRELSAAQLPAVGQEVTT
ncbi:gamma carbonic anhydrase family protein [Flavonifractor sp. An4]|uniref:gamma carbonic anhydrase family protein n=1 Tax=Flavonifractor sp. An4 TaxID=1965634 RepID=UPI000B3652A4|nr:gamma carbonic anhydrase family protein [Flavonifractor sp. An4]OUO15850.1 gamma carbonic anhydrase family protein [Flavonifractor sp. An4]